MEKNRWIHKRENVTLHTEKGEQGIHLHYSTRPAWSIYAGKKVIYRYSEKMAVIENAWEASADVVNDVMCQLEAFTANGKSGDNLALLVKGQTVALRYSDALILWDELRGLLPCLMAKKQGGKTAC